MAQRQLNPRCCPHRSSHQRRSNVGPVRVGASILIITSRHRSLTSRRRRHHKLDRSRIRQARLRRRLPGVARFVPSGRLQRLRRTSRRQQLWRLHPDTPGTDVIPAPSQHGARAHHYSYVSTHLKLLERAYLITSDPPAQSLTTSRSLGRASLDHQALARLPQPCTAPGGGPHVHSPCLAQRLLRRRLSSQSRLIHDGRGAGAARRRSRWLLVALSAGPEHVALLYGVVAYVAQTTETGSWLMPDVFVTILGAVAAVAGGVRVQADRLARRR